MSFAHIVKSAEPVFSVILSGPILGTSYPWCVLLYSSCSQAAAACAREKEQQQRQPTSNLSYTADYCIHMVVLLLKTGL